MAKLKPARARVKAAPKPGMISCIVLLFLLLALFGMLFWGVLKSA